MVSAISAADKSFSFKSGNSPILLRTNFSAISSLANESRTSSFELGRLYLSSSNCSHSSLLLSVSVYLRLKLGCDKLSVVFSSTSFSLFRVSRTAYPSSSEWVSNSSFSNLKTLPKDIRDMFIGFTSSEASFFLM